MKKTEQFLNIKLDIYTEDFAPSGAILNLIRAELKKLMRIYGSVLAAEVYLCEDPTLPLTGKTARMRVGVPGRYFDAEDSSGNWNQAIEEVAEKLRNQVRNRHSTGHLTSMKYT